MQLLIEEPVLSACDADRQQREIEALEHTKEQLVILYSRALLLLSGLSRYAPDDLKDEIECLANDSGKAGIPVLVDRANGMVVIDPYNVSG